VFSALSSPRFRRIFAAYTINRLGTWIGLIALLIAVYDHTHNGLAVAAMLVAGQVVPAFAVPPLVAKVEASSRRHELSGLYFFEAAATIVLAFLLWHFSLPGVLLVVALDGTAALTASALLRSEAARAAREELRARAPTTTASAHQVEEAAHVAEQQANAALNVAFSLTFVLGPAIGGLIAAGVGPPVALLADAATFVICGLFLLDLHPNVEDAANASVRSRLREAWRHINGVPALRALMIAEAAALIFFESAAPIEVAYVKETLGASGRGFGLLVTFWGAGVVLGSVIFARSIRRPLRAMLIGGTLAVGLGYLGFALAATLALACAAALVGGLGNGMQWASLISAVQRLTPPDLHARVMGAVESLGALCPAAGLALGGALVALSSPPTAFLVVGAGAALTTIAFARVPIERRNEQAGIGVATGDDAVSPDVAAAIGSSAPVGERAAR
jgi:predicted MFS family arabinose efflux permease